MMANTVFKSATLMIVVLSVTALAHSQGGPSRDVAADSGARRFTGKLDPALLPNKNFDQTVTFVPAAEADRKKLPDAAGTADKLFVKNIKWPPGIGKPFGLILVEPANSAPYLYADIDLDGKFSAGERFDFPAFREKPKLAADLVINVPYDANKTIYKTYPITLRPYKKDGINREVSYSNKAYATGVIQAGERKALVRYGVDAQTGKVDPGLEGLAMDTNGDGHIDDEPNSTETDYGNHGVAIFRLGDTYISTESVDPASGTIVARSHTAAEYTRIELEIGSALPDFSFVDLDDKPHRLSEYRGKYVLLDFWGTWCAPCLAEVPFLKNLNKDYAGRNLELIGMDNETGWDDTGAGEIADAIKRAKGFIATRGIGWTQARSDTINDLVNKRYRIRGYPLKILLDPKGRIIRRFNENTNDELIKLLDKLLPHASQ